MSRAFKTLDDIDLSHKNVLLRADLNVPVENGVVTDATRIERIVPTIREIIKVDGKAILISHFGRPKGKVDKQFSLEVVVPAVAELSGANTKRRMPAPNSGRLMRSPGAVSSTCRMSWRMYAS